MGYELERRSRRAIAAQWSIAQTDEYAAAARVELRISNAYALAGFTMFRAAHLNAVVNDLARDNPSLEMTGRRLEATCELGSAELIHRYITRR